MLLKGSDELGLLLEGLEATMTALGRRVDELDADLLLEGAGGLGSDGAAESDDTADGTTDRALEHNEGVTDVTVLGEPTEGVDALLGDVVFGLGVGGVLSDGFAHEVNLFVQFRTVMETVLTGT